MAKAPKPANPKGATTFTHAGKRLALAFTVNAIIAAEEAFGVGVAQIGAKLAGGIQAGQVRADVERYLAAAKLDHGTAGKVMAALEPLIIWVAEATAKDGGVKFGDMRTLFRCALTDALPDLTDAQAGVMMNDLGAQESGQLVAQAFAASFHQKAGPDRPTGAA